MDLLHLDLHLYFADRDGHLHPHRALQKVIGHFLYFRVDVIAMLSLWVEQGVHWECESMRSPDPKYEELVLIFWCVRRNRSYKNSFMWPRKLRVHTHRFKEANSGSVFLQERLWICVLQPCGAAVRILHQLVHQFVFQHRLAARLGWRVRSCTGSLPIALWISTSRQFANTVLISSPFACYLALFLPLWVTRDFFLWLIMLSGEACLVNST